MMVMVMVTILMVGMVLSIEGDGVDDGDGIDDGDYDVLEYQC